MVGLEPSGIGANPLSLTNDIAGVMPKKFPTVEEKRAYERSLYHASNGAYKDKTVARKKKLAQEASQFVWNYLKEHPCVDCNERDPIVLEFDHVGEKFKAISEMLRYNYSPESLAKEIIKCEVRCANCHRRKTAIQLGYYKNVVK